MANPSVQQDPNGPDWPLGFIKVVAAGTPVNIMSLVDASIVNDPSTRVVPGTIPAKTLGFTPRATRILFQAYKPGAQHGTQVNTGYIYIVRVGVEGDGSRDDMGSIIRTMTPGQDFTLEIPGVPGRMFSPYRYKIDADNANDGAFVTLLMS